MAEYVGRLTLNLVASLGHVAVGMLAGRALMPHAPGVGAGTMALFSGLALLPDLDYLGVMMGVPDSGPCGHRGASHSLVPPMLVALLAAWLSPRFNLPRWRTSALCAMAVGSHALLDAMTVTSRGVPLLWPFSFHRFELPWRPIPNAPCGLEYLSAEGLQVATVEFFQFLPVLYFALRPRPNRGAATSAAPPAKQAGKAPRNPLTQQAGTVQPF